MFVSYAWEDDEYKVWVQRLATRLRDDGVNARLDYWHLMPSDNIVEFMSREVRLADWVLVLCSPAYQRKVREIEDGERVTGVGWETRLLTGRMLTGCENKILAALARGSWRESAPDYLAGQFHYDLSNSETFGRVYKELLRRVIGVCESEPPIGEPPYDLQAGPVAALRDAAQARALQGSGIARKRLESHLRDIKQEVSLLITYRPAVQYIEDAFVQPRIMDGALARMHIPPDDLERLLSSIQRVSGMDDGEFFSSKFHRQMTRREFAEPSLQWRRLDIDTLLSCGSVLVLGGAGAGKSVLLAYVCWRRLELEKQRIPLFLSSKSLLSESLDSHLSRLCEHLNLDRANSRALSENVSFYIDGLDELPHERYHEVCNEIGLLRRRLNSAPLMAACRSASYGGELDFLRPVTLLPFDEVQSAEFVRRWFSGVKSGPTADDFLRSVARDDRLSELATQPLLLALMCNAFRRYLDFSRRQSTLFEQCVSTLLWQWDAERSVKRKSVLSGLDQEKLLWLHAAIATHMHESQRRFLSKRALAALLAGILPRFGIQEKKAEAVLFEMSSHQGLLVQWTAESYGFGHLALQEYLAARWFADERRWTQLVRRDKVVDPWWINVIGLAVASLSDGTVAVEQLLNVPGLSELERVRVAAHCLRYDPLIEPMVRNSVVRRVLDWYHNGDAKERNAALRMLAGIDDDWSSKRIRKSLDGKVEGDGKSQG